MVEKPKTLLIKDQKIYANLTHFLGEPAIVTNVVVCKNPVLLRCRRLIISSFIISKVFRKT